MKPGIYDAIPMEEYQRDPADGPSLSSGIAHILLTASPLHAWAAHPKLNPHYRSEESTTFDRGTAAHEVLLQGEDARIVEIDADDWRTKIAKEARDAARSAGRLPLLSKHIASVRAMVEKAKAYMRTCELGDLLAFGKPEQTLIWEEWQPHLPGPDKPMERRHIVQCRGRADWITHSGDPIILDYKTTAGSANPDAWIRTQLTPAGYDLQAMWYSRGYQKITGQRPRFVFLVQENEPPYACSLVGLTPAAEGFANEKIDIALGIWRDCLAKNDWPAYPTRVCFAEPNGWEVARFQERLSVESMLKERV